MQLAPGGRLAGHTGPVLSVRFTENGAYAVSCSEDRSLILWNPHRLRQVHRFAGGHNREIRDVAISGDNAALVSAGGDCSLPVWDVAKCAVRLRLRADHCQRVNSVVFAAESLVAAACGDKSVRLYDLRGGRAVDTLTHAADSVEWVASAPGPTLVSTSLDGFLRLYDARKGVVAALDVGAPCLRSAVTADGRCVAVPCLNSALYLIDAAGGVVLNTFRGHHSAKTPVNAAFSPDEAAVAVGSEDGRFCVYDLDVHHTLRDSAAVLAAAAPARTDVCGPVAGSRGTPWGAVHTVVFAPESAAGAAAAAGAGAGAVGAGSGAVVAASAHHDGYVHLWRCEAKRTEMSALDSSE